MPEYDPVTKISIVPRGAAGGLTFFAPSEERLESGLYSRTYLENQMAVALGGRVAEELIFGEDNVTTGASGDFQQARFYAHSFPFLPFKLLATQFSGLGVEVGASPSRLPDALEDIMSLQLSPRSCLRLAPVCVNPR